LNRDKSGKGLLLPRRLVAAAIQGLGVFLPSITAAVTSLTVLVTASFLATETHSQTGYVASVAGAASASAVPALQRRPAEGGTVMASMAEASPAIPAIPPFQSSGRRRRDSGAAGSATELAAAASDPTSASPRLLAAASTPAEVKPEATVNDRNPLTAIPDNVPTVVANINNAPGWQPHHDYRVGDTVVAGSSPLRGYRATRAGRSGADPGPSGTGSEIADGNVLWAYLSNVDFRGIAAWIHGIPHEQAGADCKSVITMQASYVGVLWNGQEYVQDDALNFGNINGSFAGCGEGPPTNWNAGTQRFWVTLTAAPGESFADHGPGTSLGYNPANGVAIRYSGLNDASDNAAIFGFSAHITLQRLQIKSDRGNGISMCCAILDGDLIDAGRSALQLDAVAQAVSDVVIVRGLVGMTSTYNNLIDHVTIVNPDGTGLVGLQVMFPALGGPTTLRNSAIFGFKYPTAIASANAKYPAFSTMSDNNATDAPRAADQDAASFVIKPLESTRIVAPTTAAPLPGEHSLFAVPFTSTTFVNPKSDFRLAEGSRLIGAGSLGAPMTFDADSSPDYPYLLHNMRHLSATVPLLPVKPLYYPQGLLPLLYRGMLVTGAGIPQDTIITLFTEVSNLRICAYLSRNVTQDRRGATYTASWEPIENTDIVGTPRRSPHHPDIGPWQRP
jgi:hypothetical protein